MAIEKELLDQLLAGRDPNEVFAKDGLLDDLKKALSERILNAELDEHLEEERDEGNAQSPQWHLEEVGADRRVEDDPVDPARSGGHL
jgi:putative transposase